MDPGHLHTVGNILMIYVNLACYFLKTPFIPHILTSVRVSLRFCPRILVQSNLVGSFSKTPYFSFSSGRIWFFLFCRIWERRHVQLVLNIHLTFHWKFFRVNRQYRRDLAEEHTENVSFFPRLSPSRVSRAPLRASLKNAGKKRLFCMLLLRRQEISRVGTTSF